jgi:uncharacterized delta-60 repeat protein
MRLPCFANDRIVTVRHTSTNLVVKRFNVTGTPDTSFDGDGSITHSDQQLGIASFAIGGVKALADNKLIIANYSTAEVVLIKLRANGQLDNGFSGDGVFKTVMPDNSVVQSFTVQPDGKIIIGGFDHDFGGGATLIRVLADGSGLDPNFGNLGIVAINSDQKISFINEIVLQNDGKIILAGSRGSGFFDSVVGRLLPNGIEDPDFEGGFQSPVGFGSLTQPNDEFNHVALDASQRIVVGGVKANLTGTNRTAITGRFNTDAALDNTFSGNGRLDMNDNFLILADTKTKVNDLAIQADNKPVFLIDAADLGSSRSLIVRLTVGGARDTTFNATGKVVFPTALGGHTQIEIDSKGRIVILGQLGIARYAP